MLHKLHQPIPNLALAHYTINVTRGPGGDMSAYESDGGTSAHSTYDFEVYNKPYYCYTHSNFGGLGRHGVTDYRADRDIMLSSYRRRQKRG